VFSKISKKYPKIRADGLADTYYIGVSACPQCPRLLVRNVRNVRNLPNPLALFVFLDQTILSALCPQSPHIFVGNGCGQAILSAELLLRSATSFGVK
jgi:hypothetical protein